MPTTFWASDSAFENQATLGQTISGLNAGRTYEVTFNWAAAQLRFPDGHLWNGDTTDYWSVNLGGTIDGNQLVVGGTTQNTGVISLPQHHFSGWQSARLRFVATGSVEDLFFTSIGTPPTGAPPFALLDNVVMSQVPEAATWAMLVAGFGLVGAVARRRRMATVAA